MTGPDSARFSTLLLEGLDHYRKGKMHEAVKAWEEAYLLEPTNLRAREFLRSALERIHAHMPGSQPSAPAHPWLPTPGGAPKMVAAEQKGAPTESDLSPLPPGPADELPIDPGLFTPPRKPPNGKAQPAAPTPSAPPQIVQPPPPPATTPPPAPGRKISSPLQPAAEYRGQVRQQTNPNFAVPKLKSPRSEPPAPRPGEPSRPPGMPTLPGSPFGTPTPELGAPRFAAQAETISAQPSATSGRGAPSRSSPPLAPWDDGPSLALPVAGPDPAWTSDAPPLPTPVEVRRSGGPTTGLPPDKEIQVWTAGAQELLGLNDFSGALELSRKILERQTNHAEAARIRDLCENNLLHMYESTLGPLENRPKVLLQPDEIIWLSLDPRAGFVLAQIDGGVSYEDLYAVCGLQRLDTARILSQLVEEGVIGVTPTGRIR